MLSAQRMRERLWWLPSNRWRWSRDRFQPFNYTKPDRYPWLFSYAAGALGPAPCVLSVGCSTGEELLSLHRYLPAARIKGVDINPRNVRAAEARTAAVESIAVECTGTLGNEADGGYDAVFCLAVLCHGRLTAEGRSRSTRLFSFDEFETAVAELSRCLRPGGLLFLLTTNFRFSDTAAAREFEVVLTARDEDLASDLIYDRGNRLMPGVRYRDVVFRKRR